MKVLSKQKANEKDKELRSIEELVKNTGFAALIISMGCYVLNGSPLIMAAGMASIPITNYIASRISYTADKYHDQSLSNRERCRKHLVGYYEPSIIEDTLNEMKSDNIL